MGVSNVLICGIDFETSGLDPKIHVITEVGCQLWDTSHHRAIQSMGYLVQVDPSATIIDEEAMSTTGLTVEMLAKYGKSSERALKQLLLLYDQADYICAHNGNACDRLFLRAWMAAQGVTDDVFPENKLWIDTMNDIEYPKKWNRQLVCLAAYHGFVNPFPHQALSDVQTMLRILDCYPIDQVIECAKIPLVGIRLLNINYDNREWAKARGYFPYYQLSKFQFWMKIIKENKLEVEQAEAVASGYGLMKIDIPEGVY